MTTPTSTPSNRHSFSLLFLAAPIGTVAWVAQSGYTAPINQTQLLTHGLPLLAAIYGLIWLAAYGRDARDRTLLMVSLCFAFLWFMSTPFLLAKINTAFAPDGTKTIYRQIEEARILSSTRASTSITQGAHSRQCLIVITPPLAGSTHLSFNARTCEDVVNGKDGIELKVRQGALGLPWVEDHSIVKDFATYRARIGVSADDDI